MEMPIATHFQSRIAALVSPLWTSMFKAFGSAPTAINFSEVYSALQTKVVEGQENPLAIIDIAKLFEVQKKANALVKEFCEKGTGLVYVDVVPLMVDSEGKPIAA